MFGRAVPLDNLGRGHYNEHLFKLILNWWFKRRCGLKVFVIYSSGSYLVQCSGTIKAILAEGIIRNISVKLFLIWTSGSRDIV